MNDLLSFRRNAGVANDLKLGRGETLSAAETREVFPQVRTAGLLGGARWTDYFMVSSERVLIEQLRDACRRGAVALNYTRVDGLVVDAARCAACAFRTPRRAPSTPCERAES